MIVYCDFDGTISVKDVGAEFFNNLMTEQRLDVLQDWLDGKINSKECLTVQCSYVRATKKEINALLDKLEIEKTFITFYKELKKNNIELIVLSDGLDYYINRILANYGLSDIKVISNKLIFLNNNRIKPEFPYYDPSNKNFANDKGMQIDRLTPRGETSVFIGDNHSDKCAVGHADIIFSKGEFYEYCKEKNILCIHFKNFNDILQTLKQKFPDKFK